MILPVNLIGRVSGHTSQPFFADLHTRDLPVEPVQLGEITEVAVPEREIEVVRDLVRAREDARADLVRVRHRLSKLPLRHGIVYYGGSAWTCKHEQWLRRQRFDDRHLTAVFDHSFDAVLAATAARDRLDEQILEVAASPRFADPVNRLGCLCGISALTWAASTAPRRASADAPRATRR